jgi:serine/threonine-protein kinase
MDAARWERLQALFHDAVDRPPAERLSFLRGACADDPAMIEEVLAAIAEDEHGESLLDQGVEYAAERMIAASPERLREIGPYRLIRTIGEGGMGVVFLAERTDLGTSAAVKILRDAWLSPSRRQRFATEQRTLARLNHPSIARLFDAGTLSDGTPWIVMEFVEGVPLTDHVRSGPVPVEARLRLFLEVCEAVQYAHRHLIVHRDLKPSNVFVTAEGRVKLLDFGIAKDIGEARPGADAGQTIARLMTPAYAAPEQARGEPAGVQSDVYSLGVMLFELLTGTLPVDPQSRTATGVADLDVLCLTARHPDQARRYASVEALARDVSHFLASEPLEARADSVRYRADKFVRRNWRPLAVAAAVVVAVVSLVAFYTFRLTDARNAALAEALRTRRIQSMMLALFNGGDTAAGPAEDLKVVTLVDRGLLEAQGLTGEPRVQADMYEALGGIYHKLGNLPQAEKLLTDALGARRSLAGPRSDDVAVSLVSLARLRVTQAKFDEAERLVREALDIRRARGEAGTPVFADTSAALGDVLIEKGDYPAAITVLEDVVADRASEGDTPEHAASLRSLVNAYFYAGRLDRAEEVGRTVLEMARRVHGAKHPLVADDLVNLGAIAHERGRYADAERAYREALAITEAWYGPDHTRTASNLTMLGRTLVREEHFDEGVAALRRALGIQERVYGDVHPAVASAVNELGSVALARKRLDEAAAAFSRMADIYRAVYHGKHYLVGIAVSNLGSVYLERPDYAKAEAQYREAIAIFTETQSPTHINVGIARIKLGRALLRGGRPAEAEPEILAGIDILQQQTVPSVGWLKNAHDDLAAVRTALSK